MLFHSVRIPLAPMTSVWLLFAVNTALMLYQVRLAVHLVVVLFVIIHLHFIWDKFVVGHRYGSTLVPFSEDDKEAMKYKTEKCFKVLGFTKSENVSCNYF